MSVVFERPRLTVPVGERDHLLGPATAPVTLVEYGDYECPYCGAAHASVEQVRQVMGNDLCFVFRHFPLSQIHPHAYQAAEAAEAAGAQNRFWEMHHLLFANQDRLGLRDLIGYAGALGLDLERFVTDLSSLLASDPGAGSVKLHFYTFGGLLATSEWARDYVAAQS